MNEETVIMTWDEFHQYVNEKQKEIDEIFKEVENIKMEMEAKANEIYEERGLEGLTTNNWGLDPEWLGVAAITVGDSEKGEYLFPAGLDDNHEGWVPSSWLN